MRHKRISPELLEAERPVGAAYLNRIESLQGALAFVLEAKGGAHSFCLPEGLSVPVIKRGDLLSPDAEKPVNNKLVDYIERITRKRGAWLPMPLGARAITLALSPETGYVGLTVRSRDLFRDVQAMTTSFIGPKSTPLQPPAFRSEFSLPLLHVDPEHKEALDVTVETVERLNTSGVVPPVVVLEPLRLLYDGELLRDFAPSPSLDTHFSAN